MKTGVRDDITRENTMMKLNWKVATVSADDATVETRTGRPPRLLLTLLGDYWWRRTEQLPSMALIALLAEFGVSDVAARAALGRLVRHDLLVPRDAQRDKLKQRGKKKTTIAATR